MKRYLLLLFWLLQIETFAQLDPLYNLYAFNQFMLNPAYAGIYNNFTGNMIVRKQWAGVSGAPLTAALTAHSSLASRLGIGVLVIQDQYGANKNLESQLAFSYKVIDEKGKVLSLGVQGGLVSYRYDYSKLNLEYTDDPDLNLNQTSFTKPNFGAGAFYMTDNAYIGFSVPRILNIKLIDGSSSNTRYLRHYYLSGGYVFNHNAYRSVKVKTSFLLRHVNGATSLDLTGSLLFVDVLWAGLTIRNFNAAGIITQLQINNQFRVGYCFELPTNALIRTTYGTHELSLLLELSPLRRQRKVFRYF
jgi:type IX secretion system PorP/SprF family membrane protein